MKVVLVIIWLHFIGDFILQSNKMAQNKWNSIKWLGFHCITYSIPFFYFGIYFAFITALLHFTVDFITSKMTHYLWEKKELHWFFVVIGLDQAIHFTCLLLTLKYI